MKEIDLSLEVPTPKSRKDIAYGIVLSAILMVMMTIWQKTQDTWDGHIRNEQRLKAIESVLVDFSRDAGTIAHLQKDIDRIFSEFEKLRKYDVK